ncbi:disease resistance RPP13 1 [Olea europaea subsp. europaea]|uniref:Disease resistance RPP13 1 n=1 Tax=Olea europaea subsp. europaea TaxID=158383 RepID=A0A8S0SHT0_OLEEU|nr:disease resistance RPP13 1 [Olea europaea subsp. europaea]
MNPSQFYALTQQIAAIQTQMTATLEESKALSVSSKNFKHIPHSIDVNNFKVSHNGQHCRQGNQKYFRPDRKDRDRNRDQIRERERDNFEILTQWNALKQGNQLVTEYITQFEEFQTKCHLIEDESTTLSRFSQGLRDDLKRELFLRGVTTLDHAYSLARDYELIISTPYEKCGHRRSPISLASPHHKSIIKSSPSNVPPIWKNNCKGRDSPQSPFPCRTHIDNHPSVSLAPIPPVKSLLGPPSSDVPPILKNKDKIFYNHHLASLAPIPPVKSLLGPPPSDVPPILKNKGKIFDNHHLASLAPPLPVKSLLGPPPSNGSPILENQGRISETPRSSSHLLCVNCKDFGHISSKCTNRTLVMEERKNVINMSLEDLVYEPKLEDFDDLDDSEDTSLGGLQTLPKTLDTIPLVSDNSRSHVICHTLAQLKELDDFTGHPWRIQSPVVSIKSTFPITDQLQTDGQNEVVNQSPGNLYKSLVQKNLRNWDLIPPNVQIAYNNSVNRSLGLNPFEIVHSYKSRRPLDLIFISPHASVSISVEAFVHHLHDLHIKIDKQLHASNALYKLQTDLHKQYFQFHIRDYVILQAGSAGPFKVLKHVGPYAHVINFSSHFGHHSTLHIEDLVTYKGLFNFLDDHFLLPYVDPQPKYVTIFTPITHVTAHKDVIDAILDKQVVLTNEEDFGDEWHEFLLLGVQYQYVITKKDRPPWLDHILEDKLQLSLLSFVEFRYLVIEKDRPPWHDLEPFASDSVQHSTLSTRRGRVFLLPREN